MLQITFPNSVLCGMKQLILLFNMFICVVALRAQTDSTLGQDEERKIVSLDSRLLIGHLKRGWALALPRFIAFT